MVVLFDAQTLSGCFQPMMPLLLLLLIDYWCLNHRPRLAIVLYDFLSLLRRKAVAGVMDWVENELLNYIQKVSTSKSMQR